MNEQLENNQIFIDLIEEFLNDDEIKDIDDIDAKCIMKFIWNRGYKLVKRD